MEVGEEEKQGHPSPPGGNPLSCRCLYEKGFPLTQGTSSSWKATYCGKAWLPLFLGPVGCTACTLVLVRHPLVSLPLRDVFAKQSGDAI